MYDGLQELFIKEEVDLNAYLGQQLLVKFVLTSDGGYIIAGTTSSIDGDVVGNHGLSDMWILKLDVAGIIQWQKCFGGTGSDGASAIELSTDDGYIIAGYTFSIDGDVTEYFGNYDYWIVKISSEGILEWQESYGANLYEKCFAIRLNDFFFPLVFT